MLLTDDVLVKEGLDHARAHLFELAITLGLAVALTAAVAGDVFTSPSVDAVLAAIRAAAGPAGAGWVRSEAGLPKLVALSALSPALPAVPPQAAQLLADPAGDGSFDNNASALVVDGGITGKFV